MSRLHKIDKATLARLEELEAAEARKNQIDIELLDDYTLIINPEAEDPADKRIYIPSPTFKKIHADDSLVQGVVGPYRSGKSTGSMIDLVISALKIPHCLDGKRRARLLIARNTYPELRSTCVSTWENWFGGLGQVKSREKPYMEYFHKFNDKYGEFFLHVLFLAFDGEHDIKKLKSFETSFALLEEAIELEGIVYTHAKARIGQWPTKQMCDKKINGKLIMPTNPPNDLNWLHTLMEVEKPEKHKLFKQPAALLWNEKGELIENPDAENIENLSKGYDYYFDTAIGQTKEFIKVFIMGHYGTLRAGKPIYPDYNDDWHAVDDIAIDRNYPVKLKADYGTRAPALLICQYVDGQLRAIKEFCGSFTTMSVLYEYDALPWLNKHAPHLRLETVDDDLAIYERYFLEVAGDPANTDGGREQLEAFGLIVGNAVTNKINTRIDAVTKLLLHAAPRGKPRLIVSKKGCPMLRKGFIKGYVYKEVNTAQGIGYRDYPAKDKHPFSDIHDCLQYEALDYYHDFDQEPEDDPYEETRRKIRAEQKNRVTGY